MPRTVPGRGFRRIDGNSITDSACKTNDISIKSNNIRKGLVKLLRNTSHGDYLTQLTRYPNVFPVNCYIVREADELTLIDTGLPGSAKDILAVSQAMSLPIKTIALTHAHGDHVGSLDALCASLPDVSVVVSARESRLLEGDRTLDPSEPQTPVRGSYPTVAARPTRRLEPGEHIGSLEVIGAPGHTPGHIAFRDTRDGTVIAGDAMQTFGGIAVSGVLRPIFPWPAMATWDLETALHSARHLLTLKPTRLAIGHGPVLESPMGLMKDAIEVAARRLESTHR